MNPKLTSQLLHWKLVLLVLLKPLGVWGIGVLAAIDTAALAIPMDLIIAGYVWSDRRHFWLYPILAALGAAVGALVPYYIGRAGGEWVLLHRMERSKYEQLQARFERHHWFAVLLPAAMPPPFPFKLFAFGAGVFEMRVLPYMAAVFVGRSIHYLVLAALVVRFGPQIVNLAMVGLQRHAGILLLGTALLLAAFVAYIFHRRRRTRLRVPAEDSTA
ncbi:MAG: YqaA family protein [Acidobacteriaceae bacterium]